jgi:hypothetical protein
VAARLASLNTVCATAPHLFVNTAPRLSAAQNEALALVSLKRGRVYRSDSKGIKKSLKKEFTVTVLV